MHRHGNRRWVWFGHRESGDGIAHEGVNKDEEGLRGKSVV